MQELQPDSQELPSIEYFKGLGPRAMRCKHYADVLAFIEEHDERKCQETLSRIDKAFDFSQYFDQALLNSPTPQPQFKPYLKSCMEGVDFILSRTYDKFDESRLDKNFHCDHGSMIYNDEGLVGFSAFITLNSQNLLVTYNKGGLFNITHPGEKVIAKFHPMIFPQIGEVFQAIIDAFIKKHNLVMDAVIEDMHAFKRIAKK